MDFKYNGGCGAVLCDKCRVILAHNLSIDDARERFPEHPLCHHCEKELDGKHHRPEHKD
jgi:hypothetical protein